MGALIQLGVPPLPLDTDELDDIEDEYPLNTEDIGDSSDDDSFGSCGASHIIGNSDDDANTQAREQLHDNPPTNISSMLAQCNGPTTEVAYGYIGSLESFIPYWRLLRRGK